MDFAISTSPFRGSHRSHGQNRFSRQETASAAVGLVQNSGSLIASHRSQYHRGIPELNSLYRILTQKRGRGVGSVVKTNSIHTRTPKLSLIAFFSYSCAHITQTTLAKSPATLLFLYSSAHLQKPRGMGTPPPSHFPISLFYFPLFQILQNSSLRPSSATMELL